MSDGDQVVKIGAFDPLLRTLRSDLRLVHYRTESAPHPETLDGWLDALTVACARAAAAHQALEEVRRTLDAWAVEAVNVRHGRDQRRVSLEDLQRLADLAREGELEVEPFAGTVDD